MMPLAIAFDRIDAKQQFAGDGFVSEPLQPEFVYGFFLRRRHQAAPFVFFLYAILFRAIKNAQTPCIYKVCAL